MFSPYPAPHLKENSTKLSAKKEKICRKFLHFNNNVFLFLFYSLVLLLILYYIVYYIILYHFVSYCILYYIIYIIYIHLLIHYSSFRVTLVYSLVQYRSLWICWWKKGKRIPEKLDMRCHLYIQPFELWHLALHH